MSTRPSRQEAAFHCALLNENEAVRDEYLAQVLTRAQLEYKGTIPLRLGQPEQLRTWARHARVEAELHLNQAVTLEDVCPATT